MTAREAKQRFLENETALSQAEAALIIGCRARDVQDHIEPSFYLNSRPKYRQADVIKARDSWIAAKNSVTGRNLRILQA